MTSLDLVLLFIVKSIVFIAFWCLYFALIMLVFNRDWFKKVVLHKLENYFNSFDSAQKPDPIERSDKK